MIDGHIHLERGPYTIDWVQQFVNTAMKRNIEEIWLLEHSYRFKEFVPMYEEICSNSEFVRNWFGKKSGIYNLGEYLELIAAVRNRDFPIRILFGIEVCYFKEQEEFIEEVVKDLNLDFLVGSVHFIDDFAFDHTKELWKDRDIDHEFRRYFETSLDLIESGIFDGIAHPDCVKLFGHSPSFSLEPYYAQMAQNLAQKNMYAEQSGGIFRRFPDSATLGMNPSLLRSMREYGVRIVTVSDAHRPEDVGENIKLLNDLIDLSYPIPRS